MKALGLRFLLFSSLCLLWLVHLSTTRAEESPADIVLDLPLHGAGYGTAFFEESARRFETLRPGVRVRVYGDPRMAEQVRVRAMGGDLPDATTAELPWTVLIKAGKVLDLTPYLEEPDWEGRGRWLERFSPGALEAWTLAGRVRALPYAFSCWTLFGNRRLLREAGLEPGEPQTWDSFFAACARLREKGLAPLALPGVYLRYGDAFLRAAHYNLGGAEVWAAHKALAPGAYTSPDFVRAAALVARLADGHLVQGWEGLTHTGAQLAFLEGRAAMTVSGSWFLNEMKGRIPTEFDLAVFNFPVFPEGLGEPTAVQTSAEYFFLLDKGDARRTRALVDFFRYLCSRERAEAFVRQVNSPVALREVPVEAYEERLRETATLLSGARASYSAVPAMLQPAGLQQTLTDLRQRLFAGTLTPEDFGSRLEHSAALERARLAEPSVVRVRHPVAGSVLLACLGFGFLFLGWRWWRARLARRASGALSPDLRPRLGLLAGLGFVAPSFALYAGFVLLPGLVALSWALFAWDGLGEATFVGLGNFKWLLYESDTFWQALRNNAFLVFVPALVIVPVSLTLAYLLHRGVPGAGLLRAILLFPNLLGGIAAALLWMSAYEPHGGLVNGALVGLGTLLPSSWLQSFQGFPWLAPEHLYFALLPIYLWMGCGFNLVLYLAAMEGIDGDLYEAASLDGASPLRQFFSITLPLIKGVVGISVIFLVIGGINAFELIWLLTSQDPATGSHTLGTFLVTTLFKEFQAGRATTIAVTMLLLVLAATALVLKTSGEEE